MYSSLFLACAGTNSYIEAFLLTCKHVHNMVADALKCEEAAEEVAKLVNDKELEADSLAKNQGSWGENGILLLERYQGDVCMHISLLAEVITPFEQ